MSEGEVARPGRTLLPVGLAMLAERQPRADWIARFVDTKLLLVRLDDPQGEVALGMLSAPTDDGDPVEPSVGARTGNTSSLPLTAPAGYLKRPPKLDGSALRSRLADDCYFVAPLRRRRIPGRLVTSKIAGAASGNVKLNPGTDPACADHCLTGETIRRAST